MSIVMLLQFLRLVGSVPDRLAHKIRRRAALELLRTGPRPRLILMVCHGNICRSPYAAAVARQRLDSAGLQISIASAGFVQPNRAPPAEAIGAALDRGIDLSAHRSQTVNRALLDAADLIIVMDSQQSLGVTARPAGSKRRVVMLGDLDPHPITTRRILDPFGSRRAAFDDCYARIDRCVAQLVGALRAGNEP